MKTSDKATLAMEPQAPDENKPAPMAGNFPVDQFQVDYMDDRTGELYFKRISNSERYLNQAGQEIPDPRPHAPALGKVPEANIRDYIRTLVQSERLQQDIAAQGAETFEEANDFEVGEDYFPDSQYENDLEPAVSELIRAGTASLSAKARAEEKREQDIKARKRAASAQSDDPLPEPSQKRRKARDPAPEPDEGENHDSEPPQEG